MTLPTNTLRITGIQQVRQTSGTTNLPNVNGSSWVIDQGAVEILRGNPNEAEGTFEVDFAPNALELKVDTSKKVVDPLNHPTVYRSTITWSISIGP